MTTESVRPEGSRYIPTLDGWRAVAVFWVILSHDVPHHWWWLNGDWIHNWGNLGVDIFFGISGLLICSRLLDEDSGTGKISLTSFYLRRAFRIIPAMVVFLVVLALLGSCNIVQVGWDAWWSSLFFLNNYYTAYLRNVENSVYTNHFWSLAVEEHFYLVLPAILVLSRRTRVRITILATLVVLDFAWTNVYFAIHRADPLRAYASSRTDLKLYELFWPALLAVFLLDERFRKFLVRWCQPLVPTLILVPLWFVATKLKRDGSVHMVLAPFLFPIFILSTIAHSRGWLGRLLETQVMRSLGRMSYSIYLWQQLFFNGGHPHASGWLRHLQNAPANLIATLVMASSSYFFVEKPLVLAGHRLSTRFKEHNDDSKPRGVNLLK